MRKIFLLLLLTQLTFAQKPEQPEILYCFDFGGAFQRVAVGYTHISRVYHSPKYLWITNVQEINRSMEPDALLRDFMQLDEGEFRMGLDNGDYEIITFHYDIQEPHGPFDIYCQGQKVQSNISLVPGKQQQLSFNAVVKDEILKIKLKAKSGETFAINGLIVKGQSGRAAKSMFKNAPPDELPTVDEVLKNGNTDVENRLKELCEWYISHRLDNGFIGDFEPFNDKQMYWWYTTAFPIRTFLAAYDLFGDTRYMDATTDVLDKLVSEQLPNGAWHQTFRNKPTSRLTQAEIDSIKKNHWMNMADIGSIAGALGVACHYVSEPRKTKYINALRHFCDDWAMQWQKPSGGFTNGMEDGVPRTREYSSATGIEAGTFAFLYSVTKDKKIYRCCKQSSRFSLTKLE